jgi:TPR repeat protein
LLDQAGDLWSTNPAAATAIYLKLAQSGSPVAMFHAGYCLETGRGSDRDEWSAMEWYHAGSEAGSWTAALGYARLLNKLGYYEECDRVLENGIDVGVVTAIYRMARCKYERVPNRRMAREIRPMLDKAIALEHPGAEFFLSELMTRGKFGIGSIFRGIKLGIACLNGIEGESPTSGEADRAPAAL